MKRDCLHENMMIDLNKSQAQYEAQKVEGRSNECPRKGFYKILEVRPGFWLRKPSLMALVHWKLNIDDNYTDAIFEIQLESFNLRSNGQINALHKNGTLVGIEIQVHKAIYYQENKSFIIAFNILPVIKRVVTLAELNAMISSGELVPNLDEEFDYDFIEPNELIFD